MHNPKLTNTEFVFAGAVIVVQELEKVEESRGMNSGVARSANEGQSWLKGGTGEASFAGSYSLCWA